MSLDLWDMKRTASEYYNNLTLELNTVGRLEWWVDVYVRYNIAFHPSHVLYCAFNIRVQA